MIEIVATGPLTTVQDLGRRGWAALGVARSGAFDRGAAALANRLVGNDPDAALLEIVLGGLAVRVHDSATLALTGAACAGLDVGVTTTLRAGAEFVLAAPRTGLRSYLAVRGGFDVPPELGSRSSDVLGRLGPAPLRSGERLAVGSAVTDTPSGAHAAARAPAGAAVPGTAAVLRVVPGPRLDWFAPDTLDRLRATTWTVRAESDRIGVRLDGRALVRARAGELPSEPTLPGALQVPPDGRPIVFGPDAPVTGGYPVLAVLAERDLDAAAQLRPGDAVRFAVR